jgi:hypothetical protein
MGTAAGALMSMGFAELAGWLLGHTHYGYTLLFILAACSFPLAITIVHVFIPRWEPLSFPEEAAPVGG